MWANSGSSGRTMRIAVIGAGMFAGAHIKSVTNLAKSHNVEVAAVVSRSGATLPAIEQRFTEMPGFVANCGTTDLAGVLADQTIDACVLCVPYDQHCALAKQVIAAGQAVLIEKAFTIHLAEAQEIAQLAQQAGVLAMVGQSAMRQIMLPSSSSLRLEQSVPFIPVGLISCSTPMPF